MASSYNDVGGIPIETATAVPRTHSPLPLSIAVRNFFPPLAVTAAFPDVDDDDPATATAGDDGGDGAIAPSTSPLRKNRVYHQHTIQSLASKMISSAPLQVEDRCEMVSREVLLRTRLDVVAKPNARAGGREDAALEEGRDSEIEIYSLVQQHRTAHPRWDHLNEQMSSSMLDQNTHTYYARVVMFNDGDLTKPSERNERILEEVPLHPSQLRRLPSGEYPGRAAADDGKNNHGMMIPHSLPPNTALVHYNDGYTRVLPSVYHLLVRRGVVAEGITDLIKLNGSGGYMQENGGGKEQPLFEEKTFKILGDSEPKTTRENTERTDTGMGMLGNMESKVGISRRTPDNDRALDLLSEPAKIDNAQILQEKKTHVQNDKPMVDERKIELVGCTANTGPKKIGTSQVEVAGVTHSRNDKALVVPEPIVLEPKDKRKVDVGLSKAHPKFDLELIIDQKAKEGMLLEPTLPAAKALPLLPLPVPSKVIKTTLGEIEELRQLVQLEQQLLDEDQRRIFRETDKLKSIMQQVQQLDNSTIEIMKAVGAERTNLYRSEFRLKAYQNRLLQHLRLIFPIRLMPVGISVSPSPNPPQHQYTIAGLPLPDDVHNPAATDSQVSTALGFLCHLMSLTSKYLGVSLRFPVVCKFSRSAVLFGQAGAEGGGSGGSAGSRGVYPLFRERGAIDREQLDYGLMLLERNMDCLLSTRKVKFRPGWNLLAKMDSLLLHVINGEDPSFVG